MELTVNQKVPKSSDKYKCIKCDYSTSRFSQYERHLATDKHKKHDLATLVNRKSTEKVPNSFYCQFCNKSFKDRSGLWRHKKTCVEIHMDTTDINIEIKEEEVSDKDLIMMLLKQNTQLIEQNAELIKNGTHTTTNSHNTNSHNKTFNLNLFLNETCKDAMNIQDFVNSITLQ